MVYNQRILLCIMKYALLDFTNFSPVHFEGPLLSNFLKSERVRFFIMGLWVSFGMTLHFWFLSV